MDVERAGAALSDRPPRWPTVGAPSPRWNAGGDSPAGAQAPAVRSRPSVRGRAATVPYAELHCHSNFCFLDGASHPEELVDEAARLGLEALALTDHDGFYGDRALRRGGPRRRPADRLRHRAHAWAGPRPASGGLFRSEEATATGQVDTGSRFPDPRGLPDPAGNHLVLLADGPPGYARLARALSLGHLAGEKGAPQFTLADLADATTRRASLVRAHRVPQGRRAGRAVRPTVRRPRAASCNGWSRRSGATGCSVELWDHGDPLDSARNDALAELAAPATTCSCVATNNVHYAAPAATASWPRRSPPCGPAAASTSSTRGCPPRPAPTCARGAEQDRRFARYPGVVERGRRARSGGRRSTSRSSRPTCRRSRAPTASSTTR